MMVGRFRPPVTAPRAYISVRLITPSASNWAMVRVSGSVNPPEASHTAFSKAVAFASGRVIRMTTIPSTGSLVVTERMANRRCVASETVSSVLLRCHCAARLRASSGPVPFT